MRRQRGPHGRWASLYGTTTLRLEPWFAFPAGGPRYEVLVFDGAGDVIVPLNEWHRLMRGYGARRTRDTYLAALRPWFGFLAERGYAWNAHPDQVREYTRQFLLETGCVLQRGSVEGWFVRARDGVARRSGTAGCHSLVEGPTGWVICPAWAGWAGRR